MERKCPNCGEVITYLEVSKQIEGTLDLDTKNKNVLIEWQEQEKEPEIYICPKCLTVIDEKTLKDWGIF